MLALLLPVAFLILASIPTAYVPKFVLSQIDGFLRPQDRNDNMDPLFDPRGSSGSSMTSVFVRFQHIFKARSVQALMVQHLTMLLTFGITSPMLAFVIACAMVIDSYVLQTLMIRYVEFQTRSSVFYNTFNTNGSGSNTSGSVRDSMGSNSSGGSNSDGSSSVDTTAYNAPSSSPTNNTTTAATINASTTTITNNASNTNTSNTPANKRTTSTCSDDCRISESSLSTTTTDTTNTTNTNEDSIVSRLYEEERLAELDSICGTTYRSVHHTIWLVYYCCVIFYSALLFDIVGDARGLESALSVPISGLAVGGFFRLTLSSIVVMLRGCVSGDDQRLSLYKQAKRSEDANNSCSDSNSGGVYGPIDSSDSDVYIKDKTYGSDLATALLPSDEHFAMHGQLGPPACVDSEHDTTFI